MGKFSKKSREYSFVSLEEMIFDIIQEYDDNNDVSIALTYDEVPLFITALISTGKFAPRFLEWGHPEINGYSKEYIISVSQLDNGSIYLEKYWNDSKNTYIQASSEDDICFVSQNVSKALQGEICKYNDNIILFDIQD